MTKRDEEIRKAAVDIYPLPPLYNEEQRRSKEYAESYQRVRDQQFGFIHGAKWADEHRNEADKWNHPFATFSIEEFDAEKEKVKQQVINKACAFIRENLHRYDESIGWSREEFIENFIKDMEG